MFQANNTIYNRAYNTWTAPPPTAHPFRFCQLNTTATMATPTIQSITRPDGTASCRLKKTNTSVNTTAAAAAAPAINFTIALLISFSPRSGVERSDDPHTLQYSALRGFTCFNLWQYFTSKLDPHWVQNLNFRGRRFLQM